jgi:S-adenosylmethionine uptake transporter
MNSSYIKGLCWFVISLVISNMNDVAAKILINNMDPMQVSSLRFFWSIISLIPVILYYGPSCLKTKSIFIHIIRGSLFYIAISMWIWGVGIVPLSTVTTISFTVPIFVLILAPKFLKESVDRPLWISTIFCLFGTILALEPLKSGFEPLSLVLLASSFIFATLDVINKRYIVQEGMIPMLFYSALVSFICSIPAASFVWNWPSGMDVIKLALLGIGSNAILYCILQAFKNIKASDLSPYRYLELILSLTIGYIYFNEIPSGIAAIGSLVIVCSTFYIAKHQSKSK